MVRKPEDIIHADSSPELRAARLRSLRAMTGKPREYFQRHYGIARGTLQNWESNRHGGLTKKGADLIIKALRAEQIAVDSSWLLHGVGDGPHFIRNDVPHADHPELEMFTKELIYFRQGNEHSIDHIIKDASMAPIYQAGDYVCGCRRYMEDIKLFCDKIVIAQTIEYGTVVRILKAGEEPSLFHLFSINVQESFTHQMLQNVEVISVAPITWHRKVKAMTHSTAGIQAKEVATESAW